MTQLARVKTVIYAAPEGRDDWVIIGETTNDRVFHYVFGECLAEQAPGPMPATEPEGDGHDSK